MEKKKVAYLLGAGFSRAITENKAPTTEEFGKQLGDLFSQAIQDKYNFTTSNIELFLTKIDLDPESQKSNCELHTSREKVDNKLREIFATSNLCNVKSDGVEITKIANKIIDDQNLGLFRHNDTILTLNYDCYLENILGQMQKWSPQGGWGKYFRFLQDMQNSNLRDIEILKLHGSINFVLVGSIDEDNSTKENLRLAWYVDKNNFPGLHEETMWNDIKRYGYCVAPSYIKTFHKTLLAVWRDAALKLRETDKLVIMGASLRKEDFELKFLLSFLNKSAEIIIIDKEADKVRMNLVNYLPFNPLNIESIMKNIEEIDKCIVEKIYT